ncbi:hypothetical protein R1sor_025757 [Riccia sorocarpa]|uniref:Cytochrome P450 n=1 Tax=Riccia sorocarpa TaxID=122646 RepID=A0ABD3GBJ9_9MARC
MWTGESVNAVQQLVTALSVLFIVFLIRAWWNWQTAGRGFRPIPSKGSLGWPIIGETLSVAQCAGDFTFERLAERTYGTMFKTHLFLKPWIVITTPEEMKFVLDDPHKQMITGSPTSMKRDIRTL